MFGQKYRKMMSVFSRKDGVKDGHRLGKHQPLSNFHQIIILLGVNTYNKHASESKCTYFMAGEKRKYVNHEIYYHGIDINLELLYRWKQSVENVP